MSTYRRARTYELPYEKAIKNNRINEGQSYNAAYIIYSTSTGDEDLDLSPVLPDELNLFTDIPVEAWKNEHFRLFVNYFNKAILERNTEDISFSKFHLTELTENTVEIEWVYNYFRVYFYFDSRGRAAFGSVERNPESGRLINSSRFFDTSEMKNVIDSQIDYVIMMQG